MSIRSFATRRTAVQLAGIAAASLLALGAGAQELPQDGVYKDRIDWGLLMDLSGPTLGLAGHLGQRLPGTTCARSAGPVASHGRKINVLAGTTRFNAATDKIAYEKLVGQTPVIAISGHGHLGGRLPSPPPSSPAGADRRHLHRHQGAVEPVITNGHGSLRLQADGPGRRGLPDRDPQAQGAQRW